MGLSALTHRRAPTFQLRTPSTGGTLPPDPRRPQPPPSSGVGTGEQNSLSEPVTQHQGSQRNSLPHTRADQAAAARFPPEQMSGTQSAETRTDERDSTP